jgi:hypothetical protein
LIKILLARAWPSHTARRMKRKTEMNINLTSLRTKSHRYPSGAIIAGSVTEKPERLDQL